MSVCALQETTQWVITAVTWLPDVCVTRRRRHNVSTHFSFSLFVEWREQFTVQVEPPLSAQCRVTSSYSSSSTWLHTELLPGCALFGVDWKIASEWWIMAPVAKRVICPRARFRGQLETRVCCSDSCRSAERGSGEQLARRLNGNQASVIVSSRFPTFTWLLSCCRVLGPEPLWPLARWFHIRLISPQTLGVDGTWLTHTCTASPPAVSDAAIRVWIGRMVYLSHGSAC